MSILAAVRPDCAGVPSAVRPGTALPSVSLTTGLNTGGNVLLLLPLSSGQTLTLTISLTTSLAATSREPDDDDDDDETIDDCVGDWQRCEG